MANFELKQFTHSERQTFLNCRNLHGFMYTERLRPDREPKYFRFSTVYHKVIAATISSVGLTPQMAWAMEGATTLPGRDLEDIKLVAQETAGAELRATMAALRDYVADQDQDDALEQQEEIDQAEGWLSFAVRNYFEQTKRDWADFIVLGCEIPFSVPLRDKRGKPMPKSIYTGVIDLLLFQRSTGRVFIQDHKALESFSRYERKIQLDQQTTGYLWAARELWKAGALPYQSKLGLTLESFSGVSFNLARKAFPSVPKVNKIKRGEWDSTSTLGALLEAEGGRTKKEIAAITKAAFDEFVVAEEQLGNTGRVSTAAIDTLPELYEAALEAQRARGLPVDEKQWDRLLQLKAKGQTYFVRVDSTRTGAELDAWLEEFTADARDIRTVERDPRQRTRNPGYCTGTASAGCGYHDLCVSRENATQRAGKNILGFIRVDDPHQEVANAALSHQSARRIGNHGKFRPGGGAHGGGVGDSGVGPAGQPPEAGTWTPPGEHEQAQGGEARQGAQGQASEGGQGAQAETRKSFGF